jgi:beta-galactosidase
MSNFTYKNKQFYMDGEPFVILSGAMHYFRIPRAYWKDRLLKLKECGFNCVETYTCWNLHEPREGEYDFSGMLDVAEFVKTAKELGLYVILRPGPYICAEWDCGGLPAWLLTYPDVKLRCYNKVYLEKIRRYFGVLMEQLRGHFASQGGNIIMLQIENEYGSFGDDKNYLRALLDMYRELEIDCLFFTSDGPAHTHLNGGTLPGVLSVANFGSKPEENFKIMQERFPDQPLMCGEYWNGWYERWGEAAHWREPDEVLRDFKAFVDNDWSINVYMFHGGTNFGFNAGAIHFGKYTPIVTSYDYGAFLTESGDRTEAYYRIRDILIEKYGDKIPPLTAKDSEKRAYGKLTLTESAKLFDNLENLSAPIRVVEPKYMEDIGQSFGYVLYRMTVEGPNDGWPFLIEQVRDRAQIYVDGKYRQTYMRDVPVPDRDKVKIPLGYGEEARLDVLVENLGRIDYGVRMGDKKGAVGMAFLVLQHFGWDMYALPMDNLEKLEFSPAKDEDFLSPTFFRGYLEISDEPCDTFLKLDGFQKGFVTVNGFNLGRYWDIGPTTTLYLPAPMLKKGRNEIIVFESDGHSTLDIEFVAQPEHNRPVGQSSGKMA